MVNSPEVPSLSTSRYSAEARVGLSEIFTPFSAMAGPQ
ncbi:hypothetical protein CSE45_2604 [Citreicella sp. SE45]|nr:hypothetical protein CSE45_2604 [Citreicella sp. SE45]